LEKRGGKSTLFENFIKREYAIDSGNYSLDKDIKNGLRQDIDFDLGRNVTGRRPMQAFGNKSL